MHVYFPGNEKQNKKDSTISSLGSPSSISDKDACIFVFIRLSKDADEPDMLEHDSYIDRCTFGN
jgi:hypothetical protein